MEDGIKSPVFRGKLQLISIRSTGVKYWEWSNISIRDLLIKPERANVFCSEHDLFADFEFSGDSSPIIVFRLSFFRTLEAFLEFRSFLLDFGYPVCGSGLSVRLGRGGVLRNVNPEISLESHEDFHWCSASDIMFAIVIHVLCQWNPYWLVCLFIVGVAPEKVFKHLILPFCLTVGLGVSCCR